ncbi:hypothetical protein LX36DRAFT_664628 [Colletotrichum falcatum]|nr:hypothetical protein LX36DRAFT_664628 [Colletotrichum falcatum]
MIAASSFMTVYKHTDDPSRWHLSNNSYLPIFASETMQRAQAMRYSPASPANGASYQGRASQASPTPVLRLRASDQRLRHHMSGPRHARRSGGSEDGDGGAGGGRQRAEMPVRRMAARPQDILHPSRLDPKTSGAISRKRASFEGPQLPA